MRKNWIGSKNILVAESYIWWQGIKLYDGAKKAINYAFQFGYLYPIPPNDFKNCTEKEKIKLNLCYPFNFQIRVPINSYLYYTSYHSYTHTAEWSLLCCTVPIMINNKLLTFIIISIKGLLLLPMPLLQRHPRVVTLHLMMFIKVTDDTHYAWYSGPSSEPDVKQATGKYNYHRLTTYAV